MLHGELMTVVVGFFCGNTVSVPVDPRMRMASPKANPSRVFTPEGTFGWGGSCGSIYPVDSPGGYQMLGQTIPCKLPPLTTTQPMLMLTYPGFDYYGFKAGFSPDRPWMFQDFDILTFYEVNEEELNAKLQLFRAGKYEFEFETFEFDMAEHNKMLAETAEEVKTIRSAQRQVQAEMIRAEQESLEKWRADKAKKKPDEGTVDSLLQDPNITAIEAPVNANVSVPRPTWGFETCALD